MFHLAYICLQFCSCSSFFWVHLLLASICLTDICSGLLINSALTLTHTVVLLTSTSQVDGLELPPLGPQDAARASAPISIAKPFPAAAWLLPVADLNLAVWTETRRSNIQGCSTAVCVEADAIAVRCYSNFAVDVAGTTCVVVGSDVESRLDTDAVVIASQKSAAVCRGNIHVSTLQLSLCRLHSFIYKCLTIVYIPGRKAGFHLWLGGNTDQ